MNRHATALFAALEALLVVGVGVALPLVPLTALWAALINGFCAWLLVRVRHAGGSLSRAAYLSARNDVVVNLLIVAVAAVTALTGSGWADLLLGLVIVAIGVHSAAEVWEVASEEHLAARALAGEDVD